MRNFILSMIVVFMVLCVPWFCVAHATATSSGFVHFADLDAEHQQRVFAHCSTDERISKVVDACLDDLHSRACWKYQHVMCLETWR